MANLAGMWKQDESGRVPTPLEPVVLGATLALIPVLIIEADTTSDTWRDVATVAWRAGVVPKAQRRRVGRSACEVGAEAPDGPCGGGESPWCASRDMAVSRSQT